jgi:putative ABC transport system substrate-binding protein
MVRARRLVIPLLVMILGAELPTAAQPAGKVYRIGVLANAFESSEGPYFDQFLEELKKLGYAEGTNLVIEWRSSEGDFDRLPTLAAELVRSKVDVIVALSAQPAHAAADATKSIPVVFLVVADPVREKLVGSLAKPDGNVTGLATYALHELTTKRLTLLKEAVPKATRLAVLSNPANPAHRQLLSREIPAAATPLRLTPLTLEARAPVDFEGAFEAAARDRADALYVLGDRLTFVHRAQLAELAAQRRLPTMFTLRWGAEAGGLMSYGPRLGDLFRRAASYVDRILKGAKPSELPVAQPPNFELVVNLKTARVLGLPIPDSLVKRADEVIR